MGPQEVGAPEPAGQKLPKPGGRGGVGGGPSEERTARAHSKVETDAPQFWACADVEPAGQKCPAAHALVHVGTVRPAALPKKPAEQGPLHEGVVRPGTAPYEPGGHRMGTPPSAGQYEPAAA